MDKTVMIDGRPVKFRASAAIPRLYRIKFGRDIIQDLQKLKTSFAKAVEAQHIPDDVTPEMREQMTHDAQLSVLDLTIFENSAWVMAKHADPENVPSDVGEWLDRFETFSIYEVLPEILSMWDTNMATVAIPKNAKSRRPAG